ncbi:MAG TPA: hypothetical protein VNH83_28195 [Bryobacteraceae bacterium]|nr:hypothetical protein [Bryobacteraceae bacterium]
MENRTKNIPSILPTPQHHDAGGARSNTMADHHYKDHDLINAAQNWPTPRQMDAEKQGGKRADREADSLDGVMKLWGTPTTRDHVQDQHGAERYGTEEMATSDQRLRNQVSAWESARPTPSANDHKGSSKPGQRRGQLDEAAEQLFHASPPDPTTQDGQPSSTPTPSLPRFSWLMAQPQKNRRLNPRFAAWLMGWPPDWQTVSINSDASEME